MSNKRHAQYREAARRLINNDEQKKRGWYTVSSTAFVQEMSDGAFVEVVIWVPREEADKESGESNELSLPTKS
jgi:hypothetical protein